MLRNAKCILVLAALCMLGSGAIAIPIPALDLRELTRRSDAILVGQITSISGGDPVGIDVHGQSISGHRRLAAVHVVRSVKGGRTAAEVSFAFIVPDPDLGYVGIAPGEFGMFFLSENSAHGYAITDPYYPFLPASRRPPPAYRTTIQRVAGEIAQVLMAGDSPLEQRTRAVTILSSVNQPLANTALRRAAADPNVNVRFLALGSLLERNDLSVLGTAEALLLSAPPDAALYPVAKLALGLEGLRDPRAVPTLAHLLGEGNVQVRRSAANALRNIADFAGVPALVRALGDPDRDVRYYAVTGLAKITGQDDWAPSLPLFEKDEDKYLAHWREWAGNR
jgi:HEAT repeat protein